MKRMSRAETPDGLLEPVLAELGPMDVVRRKEAAVVERLIGAASKAVVVGGGALGRLVVPLARWAGFELLCIADNNSSLWGQRVDGLLVSSPEEAVANYGKDAAFIVAIYNNSEPLRQLRDLGCARVVPYAVFCWRYGPSFSSAPPIEPPHRIVTHAGEIRSAYSCLADQRSKVEFAAQIAWRCTLDYSRLPPADDPREIYFPDALMRLEDDEVFVDCGAFDGDSIRLFLHRSGGAFGRIYACEPDEANRDALAVFIERLPTEVRERIVVLPIAVGSRDGAVRFESAAGAGSHIAGDRSTRAVEVECRRLDTALAGTSPTVIKMDIEGAEPEALAGAAETIRTTRPILAVCAYHRCEHLWTLPVQMKTILPDYKIHLRRYAEECWELVYYAIPPERALVAG